MLVNCSRYVHIVCHIARLTSALQHINQTHDSVAQSGGALDKGKSREVSINRICVVRHRHNPKSTHSCLFRNHSQWKRAPHQARLVSPGRPRLQQVQGLLCFRKLF